MTRAELVRLVLILVCVALGGLIGHYVTHAWVAVVLPPAVGLAGPLVYLLIVRPWLDYLDDPEGHTDAR